MKDIEIGNVSPKLISSDTNKKSYKPKRTNNPLIIGAASIGLISSILGYRLGKKAVKPIVPTFPEEQIVLLIDEKVDSGETLDSIANKYYSAENSDFFESQENYRNVIQAQNEIDNPDYLKEGTTLYIPVFVDVNNEYYIVMKQIENELNEVIANEKWVDYTVKYGDSFDGLASLASVDLSETANISLEIQEKNKDHFPSGKAYLLQIGDTIQIINPRIGELKRQLSQARENFRNSITINSTQKGFRS